MAMDIRAKTILEKPFLAPILQKVKIKEYSKKDYPENSPQAQSSAYTDEYDVYINRDLFYNMSDDEQVGVIIHELLHIAYLHITRAKEILQQDNILSPYIWNIATDYLINKAILQDGLKLPKGVVDDERIKKEFGITITKKLTAEQIYYLLQKNLPQLQQYIQQFIQQQKGQGQGQNQNQQGNGQGQGQNQNQQGQNQAGQSSSGQKPNGQSPTGLSQQDLEKFVNGSGIKDLQPNKKKNYDKKHIEKIKEQIAEAVATARMVGDGSSAIARFLEDLFRSEINWKSLIRKNITAYANGKLYSHKQYNKKKSYLFGNKFIIEKDKYKDLRVICIADTSGSVSEQELKKYISEIFGLVKTFGLDKIKIIQHTIRITQNKEYKSNELKHLKIEETGGTDFKEVLEYLLIQQKSIVVWFSDFYAGQNDIKEIIKRVEQKHKFIYVDVEGDKIKQISNKMIYK